MKRAKIRYRRIQYAVFLCLLLPSAYSCSSEEEHIVVLGEPVYFAASSSNGMTRGTTFDNMWTSDINISVCDKSTASNRILLYHPNQEVTVSGQAVVLSPDAEANAFFWSPISETRTFSAWYPYSSTEWTLPKEVTVPIDQSSMTEANYKNLDLLYAPATTFQYKQKPALLTFYHQCCRIVVNINYVSIGGSIDEVTLGTDNLGLSANITTLGVTGNIGTGTATVWGNVSSTTSSVKMRKNTANSNDSEHYAVYECILPPQSGGDYSTALITIKGTRIVSGNNIQKSYIYRESFDYRAGYQYNYNFTLSKQGALTIATVTVGNWGTVSFHSGDADVPDDTHNIE